MIFMWYTLTFMHQHPCICEIQYASLCMQFSQDIRYKMFYLNQTEIPGSMSPTHNLGMRRQSTIIYTIHTLGTFCENNSEDLLHTE